MSFQDLLNQPLPSQMGDNYIMEAANPAKIAADVMDLNKTYKASTKAIKEKIASVRNAMKSKKFQAALNVINNCRKDVINDKNEIGKRVKAIESAGLNKNTIRAITAGTAIAAGAKIAYDVKKSSDLKKAADNAFDKYTQSEKIYRDTKNNHGNAVLASNDYAARVVQLRLQLTKLKSEESQIDQESDEYEFEFKTKRNEINKSNQDKEQKDKAMSELYAARNSKNEEIIKRIEKNARQKREIESKIADLEEKRKKETETAKQMLNDMGPHRTNANKDHKTYVDASNAKLKHDDNAKISNMAMIAGGGVSYAAIKLFTLIRDNYEKYYDGVQKTLDQLEDKCEKQSQNIKECLLDFVMLNQDMEMLMESAEEGEYMEAGKVENLNKIRVEVKKYKTMSKDAVKELKDMVTKIREQIKAGDFKSAKQAIKSCRTKLNDYINKDIKQRDLIKSLGLNSENIDKFSKITNTASKAAQITLVGSLAARNERWRTAVKADDAEKANNKKDLKKYEKQYNAATAADKGFTTAGKIAAGVGVAAILGGAYILSYHKCINSTLKYFIELSDILDDLEKKCKTRSRDIKESMIDFVIATQDIEMVLESAEEIDYIDEE